jgi:hypothetical protein
MIDPGPTAADHAYVEAMRAEVNWAPLHFNGWAHYEQARPTMPGETIEVIARWPDKGYTLQYRPLLGELTEARQYPVDPFPTVTVLGRVEERHLISLRTVAASGEDRTLTRSARDLAVVDRTIPTEPSVRTGSSIPAHAEIPVHYEPHAEYRVGADRLIDDDHPSAAYILAGQWNLRLGPPVGVTPTGLLVFQPLGIADARLTFESPTDRAAASLTTGGRVGIYRYEGLGCWRQTASIDSPSEMERLVLNRSSALSEPRLILRADHGHDLARAPAFGG